MSKELKEGTDTDGADVKENVLLVSDDTALSGEVKSPAFLAVSAVALPESEPFSAEAGF